MLDNDFRNPDPDRYVDRVFKHEPRVGTVGDAYNVLRPLDYLYPRVVDDSWTEEWTTIKEFDIEFTPANVPPLVAKRCVNVVRTMETDIPSTMLPPKTSGESIRE